MKRWILCLLLLLLTTACWPVPITPDPTVAPPSPTVTPALPDPTTPPDLPTVTAEPPSPLPTPEPPPPTAIPEPPPPATPVSPLAMPEEVPPLPEEAPIILLPQSGVLVDDIPEQMYTVEGFLILLASGALSYLIGAALSYLFAEVKRFQKLTAEQKRAISIGASIALPLLAQTLLMTVPRELLASFNPLWAVFVSTLAGLTGNKQTYRGVIKPQEREWIVEDGVAFN